MVDEQPGIIIIDLSHNDVKYRFKMLHEIELAAEKCPANHIKCNMNFSAFDVIIRKVYCEAFSA